MQRRVPFYRVWSLNAWHWLDDRYQLQELWHVMVEVPIPRNAVTYFLGGITLFLFGVQVITGILLAVYYQPTPESAYASILFIMNDVRFGWLIRSIHAWGANLMIIFCLLHLLRVYLQSAYKAPREMTWVVGVFLLIVTLAFGFTGYLLPWDQRAFWATVVGTEIAGAVPGIGGYALEFLRGGPEISALTLSRFFATHVLILPVSLGILVFLHLVMVHQQGLADPKEPVNYPPAANKGQVTHAGSVLSVTTPEPGMSHAGTQGKTRGKWLPFFPNYVLDEVIAWYVVLALIVILASLLPVGLEERADPFKTPPHVKPEWYFLAVYQGLKLVPRTLGILAPIIGIVLLLVLPFIDRNPEKLWRRRPLAVGVALITLVVMIVLSIWGWVS
jgi:ubiquinol-cytochrome c reductase cytochrome b subunit